MRHGIDEGISFLDMADLYGSHPFVKDVLKDLPRDKFALLSKIWPRKADWVTPSGGATQEVDRFRKELNIDQLDVCLIHCMLNDQWPTEYERIRDELSALKDKGVVRAVGVSCHDFGALKVAAAHPWVDVIFARINYKGGAEYSCDAPVEELAATLKTARANGKAVVGMKIFGAGKLVKPEEKDTSLKYVFENDLVDAITIGMMNPRRSRRHPEAHGQRLSQRLCCLQSACCPCCIGPVEQARCSNHHQLLTFGPTRLPSMNSRNHPSVY